MMILHVHSLFIFCLFSCKKLVSAKKQMSILQAPNVLVIQLKVVDCLLLYRAFFVDMDLLWFKVFYIGQRFEGIFGGKIDKAIAFEEVLVLSSYMCKASQVCNATQQHFTFV